MRGKGHAFGCHIHVQCFGAGTGASGRGIWAKMKSGAVLKFDVDLDCTGLLCPLPVLRARKRLMTMQGGQVLRVLASDAMAAVDMPHFCDQAGHGFLGSQALGDATAYFIRRGL